MPSNSLPPIAQTYKQCQNCFKAGIPLKNCSGCKRSHYCSVECQKADWPAHKRRCRVNQQTDTQMQMKDSMAKKLGNPTPEGTLKFVDQQAIVKKWLQMYKPMLHAAVTDGLTLKETPERCQTHVLVIHLQPAPNLAASKSKKEAARSIACSFLLDRAFVTPLKEAITHYPQLKSVVADITEKGKPVQDAGGLGFALLITMVPSWNTMQITPCGFPRPLVRPSDPLWAASLKTFIENEAPV